MSHTVAAIDLGASSGRVLTGTLSEGVLTVRECARFPNGVSTVPTATGEDLVWDIVSLWNGIRTGLAETSRRGPIDAIGIDTWGVDYGLLDADGRLLSAPSAYRSPRTAPASAEVYAQISPMDLYAKNGLQFQPFNTMFQLIADRDRIHAPLAARMLLIPDLLGFWLTGTQVCEVTNASTTGLIDPLTRSWHPEIIDLLAGTWGVPVPEILGELVEPGTIIGPARLGDVDLLTSSGEPTPLVAVGSHDTASAVVAVPSLPIDEGGAGARFGFVSSGTWSLVGVELDHPVRTEESLGANFSNELGVDGTVRFLKNVMGMWVQQEVLRQWREDPQADLSWARLDAATESAQALRTVIDINDPRFLAPGDMMSRINDLAEISGEPTPRTDGEYLRTITESLAVAYRRALREASVLSGETLDVIHIVGGGSKNALLCQLTADATGLPVVAGPVEGTAIGNMVVQLRAIGALSGGLENLRGVVAHSVATARFEPTPGGVELWDAVERRVFADRAADLLTSPAPSPHNPTTASPSSINEPQENLMTTSTHPTTAAAILASMGKAGARLDHVGACEAGAGNISVSIRHTPPDLDEFFPQSSEIDLPVAVPGLAGWTFFVTGSGCRLREVGEDPRANVSVIIVGPGGKSGTWRTSPLCEFERPTSEFNSHLGVHEDQVLRRGVDFQTVIHAQPPYLVTLSHIPELRNDADFNRAVLRWEPETVVQLPAGIKVLEFMVPGGQELGAANVEGLREHQIVLWSKHGIMVRSDISPLAAVDKVEYVETGAMYEYRNMAIGGVGEGLADEELGRVVRAFSVPTTLY